MFQKKRKYFQKFYFMYSNFFQTILSPSNDQALNSVQILTTKNTLKL